jgi:hypothetical protein
MENESHVEVTSTDSARQYLVQWMQSNFPTDKTFATYIQGDLAGDFAWQLAKALSTQASATGAAVTPDAAGAPARLDAAAEAGKALRAAVDADSDMADMPHWGGVHHDMYQQMRTITQSLRTLTSLFPVLVQPAPFTWSWTRVEDGMPEERIRVWASTGKFDIGHDCFFGGRSSIQQDQTRLWRHTHSEEPVAQPVTHWMSLPAESPDSADLRDPFAALKPLATKS